MCVFMKYKVSSFESITIFQTEPDQTSLFTCRLSTECFLQEEKTFLIM